MTLLEREKLLTAEEFADLPKEDDCRYELVRGRVVKMPPEFTSSSIVATNLVIILGAFVRARKLGVCWAEGGGAITRRHPDSVRAPDVAFLSAARVPPGGVPRRGYLPVPDLVVEVKSVSDRVSGLIEKIAEFLDAGARLGWLVDPDERAVIVFRLDRVPRVLTGADVLDGEDVLPGFTLPLPSLWKELAPPEDAPNV